MNEQNPFDDFPEKFLFSCPQYSWEYSTATIDEWRKKWEPLILEWKRIYDVVKTWKFATSDPEIRKLLQGFTSKDEKQ